MEFETMVRVKRLKKVHLWIEEDEKEHATKDAENRGETLSALIRRLLKENHERPRRT